ncbi:MAG: hypothetical protein WBD58_19465 [Geitlerinemataceae cyanobacterium]
MFESLDLRFTQYLEAISDDCKDWWKPSAFTDEIDDYTGFEFELKNPPALAKTICGFLQLPEAK